MLGSHYYSARISRDIYIYRRAWSAGEPYIEPCTGHYLHPGLFIGLGGWGRGVKGIKNTLYSPAHGTNYDQGYILRMQERMEAGGYKEMTSILADQ